MTTAFVLTGGGSLGAVQVGMLQALADRGMVPDLLVGASVGALNAAFLAADPSPANLHRLAAVWTGVRRADVFPLPGVGAVRALTGHGDHLVSGSALHRLIERNLPYERLEDARWPVTVVATEVATGLEVALSRGPAVDAVLASSALPGVFPPVEIEGHLLMDGGVVNNAPISLALEHGADRVIVLPTGYACALARPPRSAIGMVLHAFTLAIQQRLIAEVAALQDSVDLRVVPPLCPLTVSPVEFARSAQLIERARATTRRWLDSPRANDQTRDLRLHRHPTPHPRDGDQSMNLTEVSR
jgi:NTE family protein